MDEARILSALRAREDAEKELRAAIADAVEHGASVRELADLMGVATATIQRWKGRS